MSRRVINEKRANTSNPEWVAPKPQLDPLEAQKVETPQEHILRLIFENDRLNARVRDLEAKLEAEKAKPASLDPQALLIVQQLAQAFSGFGASAANPYAPYPPIAGTPLGALSPQAQEKAKSKGRPTAE